MQMAFEHYYFNSTHFVALKFTPESDSTKDNETFIATIYPLGQY
jgi:hypothetical protein